MNQNSRMFIIVSVLYALIQMLLTVAMFVLLIDASNARATARNQRGEIICILKILPEERTDGNVEACGDTR